MTSPHANLDSGGVLPNPLSPFTLPPIGTIDALFDTWLGTTSTDIRSMSAFDASETDLISQLSQTSRVFGARSRGGRGISNEQIKAVKTLLWRVSRIEVYDAGMDKIINNLGKILTVFIEPLNHVETPIPEISAALIERFESRNWGVVERVPTPTPASDASESKKNEKPKAKKPVPGESNSEINAGAKPAAEKIIWPLAPDAHPIFGLNGCMHHIAVSDNHHYHIHREKGDAAIFGHNGFEVGQCWPLQVATVRDGVHGSHQAGIYGTPDAGVYSLVISGFYSELDNDDGDHIFYSVSGARESTADTPDVGKRLTRALLKSINTGKPIRVLRADGCKWPRRPKEGRRYDGLYQAVAWKTESNNEGGKFVQVELVRMEGQNDICKDRPKGRERWDFQKVKDGY